MADGNYDEVTNTVYVGESRENMDPMFHWDLHFPERISRLRLNPEFSSPVNRRQRRTHDRCSLRYKTQPITFDEITEVDEDTSGAAAGQPEEQDITAEMRINFKKSMAGFSRSMGGLVASGSGVSKTGSGSDKENTPCQGNRLTCPDHVEAPEQPQSNDASGQVKASSLDYFRSVGSAVDGARHRRRRINRKSHYRNTVEEVPETESKVEETNNA